jgi:hypothetical protein
VCAGRDGVHGVDRLTPKTNVLAALNPRLRKFIGFSLLRFVVAGLSASAESVGALDRVLAFSSEDPSSQMTIFANSDQ